MLVRVIHGLQLPLNGLEHRDDLRGFLKNRDVFAIPLLSKEIEIVKGGQEHEQM